jgi:Raf kinase inhibitor-like YbhB/YbcL family protein
VALQITSSAFPDGGTIPQKYSCDGANVSPPLEWRGAPNKTRSFAIICDDPDAPDGTFTHWILYDIPPSTTGLSEGDAFAGAAGVNDFGKSGYGGPCPPRNDPSHHYAFHVYALDVPSIGNSGLERQAVLNAMKGHVLDEGELVGEYRRKRSAPRVREMTR